ncbi:FmdB family zinc ribbon protein [Chloroflexota bacterium]
MPIYEYACPDCGLKFEVLRPLSQAGEAASCPKCKQNAKRILSTFACFSTNDSGLTASVGGSSCSSCGSTGCSTCGM